MSRPRNSKLNHLLRHWPSGTVMTAKQLSLQKYYKQLVKKYSDSGWLIRIGPGAFAKLGDIVKWPGAVYALQQEPSKSVHVGGLSALEIQGLSQNITANGTLYLYNTTKDKRALPKWFDNVCNDYFYIQHHLFVNELALTYIAVDGVKIGISLPERAILELIELVPNKISYEHAYDLVENMQLLQPTILQQLLEQCVSFKVKRLFLYLAEKFELPCFSHLNLNKIDLGRGKRVIGAGGDFNSKYKLSVPKIERNEDMEIGDV